jgi:hypothetical protein
LKDMGFAGSAPLLSVIATASTGALEVKKE